MYFPVHQQLAEIIKKSRRNESLEVTQDNRPTVLFRGTCPPSEWHAVKKMIQSAKILNYAKNVLQ